MDKTAIIPRLFNPRQIHISTGKGMTGGTGDIPVRRVKFLIALQWLQALNFFPPKRSQCPE